jgi:hypothetical protein
MNPRHRRSRKDKADDAGQVPEFTPEEVDRLTKRADELLAQLHDVLGEMTAHLESVATGGDET